MVNLSDKVLEIGYASGQEIFLSLTLYLKKQGCFISDLGEANSIAKILTKGANSRKSGFYLDRSDDQKTAG